MKQKERAMPTTSIYAKTYVKAYITYTIGWLPEMGHSVYKFSLRFDNPVAKPVYIVHTANPSQVVKWFRELTDRYDRILAKSAQSRVNAKGEVQERLL